MIDNLQSYFRPKVPYDDSLKQQLASALLVYLGIGFPVLIISMIYSLVTISNRSLDGNFTPSIGEWIGIIIPFLTLAWFWGIRNGFYRVTAITIIIVTILPLLSYWEESLNTVEILLFALPLILTGLLLGQRASIIVYFTTLFLAAGPSVFNGEAYTDFTVDLSDSHLSMLQNIQSNWNATDLLKSFKRESSDKGSNFWMVTL